MKSRFSVWLLGKWREVREFIVVLAAGKEETFDLVDK